MGSSPMGFIALLEQNTDFLPEWRCIVNEQKDINVLALIKGNEQYIFLYDDESSRETILVLGRFASNPDISFTWHDAAALSQKIRQEATRTSKRR